MATKPANQMTATELFNAYARIDADRDVLLHSFIAMAGDAPTFDAWEAFRKTFGDAMRARTPGASMNTVDKSWCRFVDAARNYAEQNEYTFAVPAKPKSASEAATKKAAQRAKPEAVDKAQSVTELEAIALPDNPVEAAKLQAQIAAKRVSLIQAEQKAAQKEREAALKARGDALIAFVREAVKTGNAAVLAELEAMRDHDVPVMLTAVPLKAIQEALPGLIDLAASAPAKVAKKGRKAVEPAPL